MDPIRLVGGSREIVPDYGCLKTIAERVGMY
jgi:hypothetical protein